MLRFGALPSMFELFIPAMDFVFNVDFKFRFSSSSDKISIVEKGNRERCHICNSFSSSWKSDSLDENTGRIIEKLFNNLTSDDAVSDCVVSGPLAIKEFSFLFSIPCL